MRKSVCRLKFMRFCSRGANRRLNATRGRGENKKSIPPAARKQQLEKQGVGGGEGTDVSVKVQQLTMICWLTDDWRAVGVFTKEAGEPGVMYHRAPVGWVAGRLLV